MRFAVVRLQSECGAEVGRRFGRLSQVIQHVSASFKAGRHVGIDFEGAGEIIKRVARLAVVRVHIAFDQRQIFVIGENRIIFVG